MGGSPQQPGAPPIPGPATVGADAMAAVLRTTGHQITFKTTDVNPPSNLYISPDDYLLIEGFTSVVGESLQVRWRTLGTDGYIHTGQAVVAINVVGSFVTALATLGEGFLLNLEVLNTLTSTQRGQLFVTIFLWRGSTTGSGLSSALLLQDYADAFTVLGWPGGRILSSVEGPGAIRSVVGTQPAAGAEISETVTAHQHWRLKSLNLQLTTSATVATRQVSLRITDGVNLLFQDEVEATQAASLTENYFFALGRGSNQTSFVGTTLSRGLPDILLGGTWKITTLTAGIQAGDQWAAPIYSIEQWLGPP